MLSVKIQFNQMLTLRKCVLMSAQRNGEADMRNAVQLVDTAVRVMKAQGSDIPELPRLAAEAVRFLEYDTPATSIQGKERRTMTQVNRRSALSVGLAAMAAGESGQAPIRRLAPDDRAR